MQFNFYRDFYYGVKQSLLTNSVTFLLGPRKSGKTVCLKQLDDKLENTEYVDFKTLDNDKKNLVFNNISETIKNNDDKIYLLDEITYAGNPELEICSIASQLADINNPKIKIVFAGSQSVALESWANRAFAGNAGKIVADFLSYSEFLEYKGINVVSADTYKQFLYEAADFYHFNSLKEYLKACLEETIVSNANATSYIFDNDCYLIKDNVDFLINVCYQTLFTLHNQTSVQTFFKDNKLKDTIISVFRNVCANLDDKTVATKIEKSFIGSYSSIKSRDAETLKQAILFLQKCGLITVTPVARDLENVPNIDRYLRTDIDNNNFKEKLFSQFNLTINYPMFYVQILKDVLGEDMPRELPNMLLGSIVECHARGMLPKNGFEYHDVNDKEIDYVNLSTGYAAEFTIQKGHKTNFELLPDYIECVMLVRDADNQSAKTVPYYNYLYELSEAPYRILKPKMQEYEKLVLKTNIGLKEAQQLCEIKKDLGIKDVNENIANNYDGQSY